MRLSSPIAATSPVLTRQRLGRSSPVTQGNAGTRAPLASTSAEDEGGGDGEHHQCDGDVEDAPRGGSREERREQPRAVAERREPGEACGSRSAGEPPATLRAVLVGERADEQDRVEIDVRVEPRQGDDGGEHATA